MKDTAVTVETLRPSARRLYDGLRPGQSQTAATRDVKDVLLATDGWTFYLGRSYDIKSARIGPGVYRVWLTERTI